ncbi:type II toxin-antitoxin system RelE/ParE family toxin (plasmid) [Robbsia andropogonis]|uniref:type II toxin-antitoxin system RelE/ParE family toxin n=1 Tax=Robbsia andropogonis TaxID=28092 RepID=UPI003D2223DA
MSITIRVTPTFERAAKKLHAREKRELDEAVREIVKNPAIGVAKKGDLAGVYVHKFKINKQEVLLSYQHASRELILLSLGSHENFYRNLKR